MRHLKFQIVTDNTTGEAGILPNIFQKWYDRELYFAGFGIAHDLFDHTTKETGEIWQELQALGANLFITHFGNNEERRYYTKGKSLGFDIASTLSDADRCEDCYFDNLPKAPKVRLEEWEGEEFDALRDEVIHALKASKGSDLENHVILWALQNRGEIEAWLKFGYVFAKRRYKGEDYDIFQLKEKVNKFLQDKANMFSEYADTGEQFTFSYNFNGEMYLTGEDPYFKDYNY